MNKGQRVVMGLVEGYEDYEGSKGTVVCKHQDLNLYYVKMDNPIDGEYTFITSPKEICRLPQ